MAASTIVTGQFVRINQTPASIGERILAFFIDAVILLLYYLSMLSILGQFSGLYTSDLGFALLFIVYAAPLFYPLLCEVFFRGQSAGKRLLNMRVVKADGTTPNLSSYLLRWIIFPIDILFSGGIGLLCIVLTRNNQRLGDLAAGTVVIKEKNYKKIQVSLDEFDFLTKGYHPVYPQATDLSLEQVDLITRTLNTEIDRRQRIEQLAAKVQASFSITSAVTSPEVFLETLLRDYQYYALEEI